MTQFIFLATIVCGFLTTSLVFARNYDDFLADSLAKNLALREEYVQQRPNAEELFVNHEIFPDSEEEGFNTEDWRKLLKLIYEVDPESLPSMEYKEEIPEQLYHQNINLDQREDEEMFQNHLTGEHKIVGGSKELGAWFDYALHAAKDQDDDNDEQIVINEHENRSDIKVDRLPAYCDPPNPCPLGVDPSKLPSPCDVGIEDTIEFNSEWIHHKILNRECSCDTEHMKNCHKDVTMKTREDLTPFMQGEKRVRLVAKKSFHKINKRSSPNIFTYNPYLGGKVLKKVTKKSGIKHI